MKVLQRTGGIAALYIAVAYLAAIPYFLLLVDYPSVVDPIEKVVLLRDHFTSMYVMHVIVYEFVAIGLIVLALALFDRLRRVVPAVAHVAAAIGVVWACLLLASSMVFNHGMEAVVGLYATDPAGAVQLWQAFEPVAQGLGGAGGELVGGLWMLLLSWAALRAKALPTALNVLGLLIAAAGLASVVPATRDAAIAFGLLHIVWFAWVGVTMLRPVGVVAPAGDTGAHRGRSLDLAAQRP